MKNSFNIHEWQAKRRQQRLDEGESNWDKSMGQVNNDISKNFWDDEDFEGKVASPESMSNANIRALQTVVSDYSLNKVLNTLAVIADKTGKHDEADMIQNLASQIQDFDPSSDFNKWANDPYLEEKDNFDHQSFDKELADKLSMSPDEFEDQVASRDIGSPFPGTDYASPFTAKAKDYIEKFRQEYRDMSDDGIDEFSVEIINHLLDNTAAQAAAKIYFGKKGW